MIVIRLAADAYVELPAGATCRPDGHDFVSCEDSDKVVARTERAKVLAYGTASTLRQPSNDPYRGEADLTSLAGRYEKARARYIELEQEQYDAMKEFLETRSARAADRLESLMQELARIQSRDYEPDRNQLAKTLLNGH